MSWATAATWSAQPRTFGLLMVNAMRPRAAPDQESGAVATAARQPVGQWLSSARDVPTGLLPSLEEAAAAELPCFIAHELLGIDERRRDEGGLP